MQSGIFDEFYFADYSGAASRSSQRKFIRLALASPDKAAEVSAKRFTRDTLLSEFVSLLADATKRGRRVCFGQDHQYGIPMGLLEELSLDSHSWREIIAALVHGNYAPDVPKLSAPSTFGPTLNAWLITRKGRPYFYSATKAGIYGIPSTDPRSRDRTTYRLTEQRRPESKSGSPKPFNRIGDPGTVGGQTLYGLWAIYKLLEACEREMVPIAVWPFDGLDLMEPPYVDRHVMIEVYPTALRNPEVKQSDDADALAAVEAVRDCDSRGSLQTALDLSKLTVAEKRVVAVEGWIFGHRP